MMLKPFAGFWALAAMRMGTFLESYDFSGVDGCPFTQSAFMGRMQSRPLHGCWNI